MGLVDYSDSESDSETPQTSHPPSKKPFQKLVDKTNPGKILVNLPTAASTAKHDGASSQEPAAKRVKTGGGRFSGFSSFLPAPKAATKATTGASSGKAAPRVGINLKTSSEAAFSRDTPAETVDEFGGGGSDSQGSNTGLRLPPPKASASHPAQPSIPEGQKPEEEVKLVGKPLMFKPLSVARNPTKKKNNNNLGSKAPAVAKLATAQPTSQHSDLTASPANSTTTPAPARKKVSLFSIADEEPISDTAAAADESAPYEPEFTSYDSHATYSDVQQQYLDYTQPLPSASHNADPNSLDSIADDLNLDPVARRELFGRGGAASRGTAKNVINFNMDKEYQHNEELRASGALDQQQHNPLRSIKPGKHSLQQLVNAVQTQRDALEDNFAKNRATQKQAGAKYGFR